MEYLSSKIRDWYSLNKRDLPWRETDDPYQIWVSEIILQQTRVAQGYDYFVRFMNRFPTVESLASATEDEVLKLWQGLGYYSRARNLHTAARQVTEMGGFPKSYDGVRALRGVGDYTAAAICSIAYNHPCAVVDGNVYRVLSRFMGVDTPIDTTVGKREFAALADAMLDKDNPGEYNQAIMDFGAIQCTPRTPDCKSCPLMDRCEAYARGLVAELPVKSRKSKVKPRYFNYIYVRASNFTFLHKRVEKDIWLNLYEPPLVETEYEMPEEDFFQLPQLQAMIAEGEQPVFRLAVKDLKHELSHRTIHARFYEVDLPEDTRSFSDFLRIDVAELDKYPVSKLVAQFLEKK